MHLCRIIEFLHWLSCGYRVAIEWLPSGYRVAIEWCQAATIPVEIRGAERLTSMATLGGKYLRNAHASCFRIHSSSVIAP